MCLDAKAPTGVLKVVPCENFWGWGRGGSKVPANELLCPKWKDVGTVSVCVGGGGGAGSVEGGVEGGQAGWRAGCQARTRCLSILTRQVISDLKNITMRTTFPSSCQMFSLQNGLNEIPWRKDFWKQ